MSPAPPPAADADAVAAAFARRRPAAEWVVDGFAGAPLQRAALRGEGVDALPHEGAAREARLVLAEEDPGLLARLAERLERAGRPVRRGRDPAEAGPGDALLAECAFEALLDGLAAAAGEARLLLHLAPLSARALPWRVLARAARLAGAELLLRLPAEDFARQGRFAGPLADLPPHLRRTVDACSALLDDPRHQWLPEWRATERAEGTEAALRAVAERLRARLEAEDDALHLRVAMVGGVPLLLATRDPEALLALDGALRDAEGEPLPAETPTAEAPLDLFPLPPPEPERDPEPRAAPRAPRRRRVPPPPAAPDLFDPPSS